MEICGYLIQEIQEEVTRVMDELLPPIRLEIVKAFENAIPEGVSR